MTDCPYCFLAHETKEKLDEHIVMAHPLPRRPERSGQPISEVARVRYWPGPQRIDRSEDDEKDDERREPYPNEP